MRRFLTVFVLVFALLLAVPAHADDAENLDGLAADALSIYVGYYGGPYYEKAAFTADELWSMNVTTADYTFIDSMPAAVIDNVAGVRLADLMDEAGIDLGSIQYFTFQSADVYHETTQFSKTSLIDTPRYCFYSLPENFGEDGVMKGAGDVSVPVDTVIALKDNFKRSFEGAAFGLSPSNAKTRFRLVFGQTRVEEKRASESIKWIYRINVTLGGAPTLTLDKSVLEGEIGSVLRTEASLHSADSVIAQSARLTWSSSDETVAAVDANGRITVKSEGTAVITATFGSVSASVTVNGVPGGGNGGSPHTGASVSASGEPVILNYVPIVLSESSTGGIQNWRKEEMSESAGELGNIRADSGTNYIVALSVFGLLLAGGFGYAALFYADIGRRKEDDNKKSE